MKKLITILILFVTVNLSSQITTQLEIYQDFKLLTYENEHQLKAPTADVLIKLVAIEDRFKIGAGLAISYEYANLHKSPYQRLAVDFQRLQFQITNKINIGYSLNAGITKRFNLYSLSYGADVYIDYKINKHLSLTALSQAVTRPDIGKIGYSNFIGIKLK